MSKTYFERETPINFTDSKLTLSPDKSKFIKGSSELKQVSNRSIATKQKYRKKSKRAISKPSSTAENTDEAKPLNQSYPETELYTSNPKVKSYSSIHKQGYLFGIISPGIQNGIATYILCGKGPISRFKAAVDKIKVLAFLLILVPGILLYDPNQPQKAQMAWIGLAVLGILANLAYCIDAYFLHFYGKTRDSWVIFLTIALNGGFYFLQIMVILKKIQDNLVINLAYGVLHLTLISIVGFGQSAETPPTISEQIDSRASKPYAQDQFIYTIFRALIWTRFLSKSLLFALSVIILIPLYTIVVVQIFAFAYFFSIFLLSCCKATNNIFPCFVLSSAFLELLVLLRFEGFVEHGRHRTEFACISVVLAVIFYFSVEPVIEIKVIQPREVNVIEWDIDDDEE